MHRIRNIKFATHDNGKHRCVGVLLYFPSEIWCFERNLSRFHFMLLNNAFSWKIESTNKARCDMKSSWSWSVGGKEKTKRHIQIIVKKIKARSHTITNNEMRAYLQFYNFYHSSLTRDRVHCSTSKMNLNINFLSFQRESAFDRQCRQCCQSDILWFLHVESLD